MWAWSLTLVALLLAWAGAISGLATLLALVVLPIFCAFLFMRRHWAALGLLAALSPVAVAAAVAITRYFSGSARLLSVGLPSVATFNVDRQTRFQHSSTGCMVDGSELVWQLPNNAALRLLSATFGPMRGAYDGPFPSPAESDAALAAAAPVSWEDIRTDAVPVGGRRVQLRPGLGVGFATLLGSEDPPEPRAVLWRDRVLLIAFGRGGESRTRRVLIDARSGRLLAYEGIHTIVGRGLPIPWT